MNDRGLQTFRAGLIVLTVVVPILLPMRAGLAGTTSFEEEPISYGTTKVNDPVAALQRRIERGELELDHDDQHGYLTSLLQHLGVSRSSQVLVFSKTSFQQRRISPNRPRALYFADGVYVGWVQEGDVLELASVDPQQGTVFYTLGQEKTAVPKFERRDAECLQCHASSLTQGVPGLFVRSVYPDASGFPILSAGTFTTDHRSPFKNRWGGWYVTGTHGEQLHMGNVVANKDQPRKLDSASGANVTDLGDRFDTSKYLVPSSDIVSLMILEHQVRMQNLITRANYQARIALYQQTEINRMLERPLDEMSASTERRFKYAAEPLLKCLLFVDDAQFEAPIEGTSGFAGEFSSHGPRDRSGRSLRELNLSHGRLFKYRCSYLIYSAAFDSLPAPVKKLVSLRLEEILRGRDRTDEYSHLSAAERRAILEILKDTKPDLTALWKK